MSELTQEQKLRQLEDILLSAVKLGQGIINDCDTEEEVKFECDLKYQNKLQQAYGLIKFITTLTTLNKGN